MPDPVEAVPDAAHAVFGDRLDLAARFAALLADDGVVRGVIGPREAGRIWTRHLLNCAVVTELIEPSARVVDIGSGAGLPGLPMAIARPDLRVDLVEPLQRRVDFLTAAVGRLGLADQVQVVRGRADEEQVRDVAGGAAWVTARAVAPLDRLVRWCLPLGDRLALIKGAGAAAEVAQHRTALRRAGARHVAVVSCGSGVVEPPATVVTAEAVGIANTT